MIMKPPMKSLVSKITIATMAVCSLSATSYAVTYYPIFEQGFETDNAGWTPFGGSFNATRVPSGTGGITSASGSFHGTGTTPATNWGGYSSVFPDGGYSTSIEFYLAYGTANDTRLDWISAISNPAGTHRRDFVFSLGYYDNLGVGGNEEGFVVSASFNASGWPQNPERDPFAFSGEGWYTFEHVFSDIAGQLSVTMNLLDSADSLLHSWTLSDPSDVIGSTVGGNRYGWVASNGFGTIAFDNSVLYAVPEPTLALGGILCLAGLAIRRRG
jgi:hypothetical protein